MAYYLYIKLGHKKIVNIVSFQIPLDSYYTAFQWIFSLVLIQPSMCADLSYIGMADLKTNELKLLLCLQSYVNCLQISFEH